VARQVSAPDAGRRNDDAIRRIRAESARRIDGQRRRQAFSSWCALATLAGGISLAALDARERRLWEERAELASVERDHQHDLEKDRVEEAVRLVQSAHACAKRDGALAAIDDGAYRALVRARTDEERLTIRVDALWRAGKVIDEMAAAGCKQPVTPRREDL
jgi:hypothetical protein